MLARKQGFGFDLIQASREVLDLRPAFGFYGLALGGEFEECLDVGCRARDLAIGLDDPRQALALAQNSRTLLRIRPEVRLGDALLDLVEFPLAVFSVKDTPGSRVRGSARTRIPAAGRLGAFPELFIDYRRDVQFP